MTPICDCPICPCGLDVSRRGQSCDRCRIGDHRDATGGQVFRCATCGERPAEDGMDSCVDCNEAYYRRLDS